ncbi:peroxisomal matrix protein [Coccidioides immitis RMSCC 2394]|uniref:Thioredoxin peroxidase n=1 Tax=Coccidioides immitis RMSCC 2394 TaxID=404692 RepID=A0A0J6Y870_COCIT|nr:peroxisomal matrix protein [Coccidioides immitis RMSCC 2394]
MNSTRLSSLLALSHRSITSSVHSCGRSANARFTTSLPFSQRQLPRSYPTHCRHLTSPRYYATMASLKAGDSFPSDVVFSCWADKKVVLFSLPGAFTPTCSASHLPGYIQKLPQLKEKGVDVVAVLAFNDAWVMSAWGKANGVTGDDILFLSDPEAKFSKSIGWNAGERTGRYAIIIDHGKVTYAEIEPGREVTVSGADAVFSKL